MPTRCAPSLPHSWNRMLPTLHRCGQTRLPEKSLRLCVYSIVSKFMNCSDLISIRWLILQISTLYRRALQGIEHDEASHSGHPSESVALLLGLRERDSSSKTEPVVFGQGTPTDPAFSKGDSTMAHFNNLYRAVVENNKPTETVKDQTVDWSSMQQTTTANVVNANHGQATGGASVGGKDHSPSSTLTNEDERPQKL